MTRPIGAVLAALLFAFSAIASGQEGRGSAAPGEARDGSRPSDGAITGGSILPGESGGQPSRGPAAKTPARRDRAVSHCNDLSGTLREECVLKEQGASTRGTREPEPNAPPPQNPR